MSEKNMIREKIMMSLRITEGVEIKLLDERKVNELEKLHLVRITNGRVICTQEGLLVLDSIIHFLS